MTHCSREEVAPVLSYLRARQRNQQWRTAHVLPAPVAGWVLAADGAPRGADGFRPLGALRQDCSRSSSKPDYDPTTS